MSEPLTDAELVGVDDLLSQRVKGGEKYTERLYHIASVLCAFFDFTPRLLAEVRTLRAAIKAHHDQRADDRCWEDDVALYRAANLEVPPDLNCVGDPAAMLANCPRYIAQRCQAGGGWRSYAEIEAENERLRKELESQEKVKGDG
ncbi:MAG: hypothetical protein KGL39_47130 [Patescibacteria group bacterium]|nr:hypothetical protein [Patescibacteria group bacterium]